MSRNLKRGFLDTAEQQSHVSEQKIYTTHSNLRPSTHTGIGQVLQMQIHVTVLKQILPMRNVEFLNYPFSIS